MYYVNDNACATVEAAEQVAEIYRAAGIPADIITEAEYFEQLDKIKYTVDFISQDELLKEKEIHDSQYTNGVQNQDYDYYEPSMNEECFETLVEAQEFAFLKNLEGARVRIFELQGVDNDGDDLWEQIQ